MNLFIDITCFVGGLYLLMIALAMKTANFSSFFLYKLIPFIIGLSCLFAGLKLVGWV